MKKIILQHWTGNMNELTTLSSANMQKYAGVVGADYSLLQGNVYNPALTPPCQKMFMLDSSFDQYDVVVMVDADMFTRKGMTDDIFDPAIPSGGMVTDVQRALKKKFADKFGFPVSGSPYWGGAIYKLDLPMRQTLRSYLPQIQREIHRYSGQGNFEDEGIMHRLVTLAKIQNVLPGEHKWCHGSFVDGIENSAMIHIRTKVTPTGPKRAKIENYRGLVDRGLIE